MRLLHPVIFAGPDELSSVSSPHSLRRPNRAFCRKIYCHDHLPSESGGFLLGLCCINYLRLSVLSFDLRCYAAIPNSELTKRTSFCTPRLQVRQCPRRIMRMISKPLIVAVAAFIVWKPRVGLMTCFDAPWCASMMLFRYFEVRCLVSSGNCPSCLSRAIASGYEGHLSVVMEVGGQSRIVAAALRRKRCAARVFRLSSNRKSINMPKGQRVGYVRVSTVDQNELRQLEGIELDKTFLERASGKDVKRPRLMAMLDL